MKGSKTEIERRDVFDKGLDENAFWDDDEDHFFDFDLAERRNDLQRHYFSFSSLVDADGDSDHSGNDGDRSGSDGITTGFNVWPSVGVRTDF